MVAIPHYENYTTPELYQALSTIRPDLYPEIFDQLEKELDQREFNSRDEAEECYFLLDKKKWPDRARALCEVLKNMGSSVGQECCDEVGRKWSWLRKLFSGGERST